jgi:hypothetical protein
MKIDASVRREVPSFRPAVPFADGGMRGWKVRVPDNFPLATPAVVDGLETGDSLDDGWLMWGANPAHNGLPD